MGEQQEQAITLGAMRQLEEMFSLELSEDAFSPPGRSQRGKKS